MNKSFQLINKNADDLSCITKVINRDFAKYPTARRELATWPELEILFGSPYYILQDDCIQLLEELSALPNYQKSGSLDTLLSGDFINRFERIAKASYGPMRLFSESHLSKSGGLVWKHKISRSK